MEVASFVFLIISIIINLFVSLTLLYKHFIAYKQNINDSSDLSFDEVEIIRRHLPFIIGIILRKQKIADDNEKIILPNATNRILYDFRKAKEIEKLTIYAISLLEERYELLSELTKVVDEEFRAKVPIMTDIVQIFLPENNKSKK